MSQAKSFYQLSKISFIGLLFFGASIVSLQASLAQTDTEARFAAARTNLLELATTDQLTRFHEAKMTALQNNQAMIVVVTATWCGYCPSLVAQLQSTLERRKDLSQRFLLHPITLQTSKKVNEKTVAIDNASGMEVAYRLIAPFTEGTNFTFDNLIGSFPTIFMVNPQSEYDTKLFRTGSLTLPRERWEQGKYHNPRKVLNFLKDFTFVNRVRCTKMF